MNRPLMHSMFRTVSGLALCFFALSMAHGQYITSTVEQVSAPSLVPGSLDNPIIRVRIEVGPTAIELYALFISAEGSTDPAGDISSINLYYTGNSTVFSTAVPYMQGIVPLSSGMHYFWVAFDIAAGANLCDTIDAECFTVYATDGTQTPVVTAPPGYAVIAPCITDVQVAARTSPKPLVHPNPNNGRFHLAAQEGVITVHDVMGGVVYTQRLPRGPGSLLDLSHLSSGSYLLRVQQEQHVASERFVIE